MNLSARNADVVIVGAGVIGLSLALELAHRGMQPLLIDRHEPGQEASSAAAGMLTRPDSTPSSPSSPACFRALAEKSLELYPAFLSRLQQESGIGVDARSNGAILLIDDLLNGLNDGLFGTLSDGPPGDPDWGAKKLTAEELGRIEPGLQHTSFHAMLIPETSLDPRLLLQALVAALKRFGVPIIHGDAAQEVIHTSEDRAIGVRTSRAEYHAGAIVNCAGAWSSEFSPVPVATRPVRGHMLALLPPPGCRIEHVIRRGETYLVPRTDGRILVGSTVEDVGFDKRVQPETILQLHQSAARLVPALGEGRIHESWVGLRPGTPDGLPFIGGTPLKQYFVATGHFRSGILLAPITARIMAQLICNEAAEVAIEAFQLSR